VLGLVTCGVPCILAGAATLFYLIAAAESRQVVWLVAALVLNVLGFLVGLVVSLLVFKW
jgi:hypothetical protein